jgi:4-hydroxythreonine-4-phosphate dehydrogenase
VYQPPSLQKKPLNRPRLAVTLGDPAGIGSEVILKALADAEIKKACDITVIGNRQQLRNTYQQVQPRSSEALASPDDIQILEIPADVSGIEFGQPSAASGAASFAYLDTAITRTLAGEFAGIVTAPIAKSCWKAAGHDYPGQTEVLAQRSGTKNYGMLFVAKSPYTGYTLRTLLATTHIPLREVADTLTPELMSQKLGLIVTCLKKDFGIDQPKIAIAGLNPHSGEQGQLGTEEQDWLFTWLDQARQTYPQTELVGLVPPDTLWVNLGVAWHRSTDIQGVYDAYLALYHDQGLIPVKLLAFDQAINTTVGLPFVRTSPDHGTAFDIAGKGIARAVSMKAAILLATELAQ